MWTVLLLPALLVHSVSSQLSCQRPGYTFIGDLCYSIVNQKLNFNDAMNYCHSTSSNLAVIHSTTQANFLASSVRTQTGAPEGIFWIGLSRQSVSARFTWDDGTLMFWSNFDLNFPKDNLFTAESTVNGKWRTLDGTQQLYFVCSYDPNGINPTQLPSSTASPESSTTWQDSTTWQSSTTSPPVYSTTPDYWTSTSNSPSTSSPYTESSTVVSTSPLPSTSTEGVTTGSTTAEQTTSLSPSTSTYDPYSTGSTSWF